MLRQGFMSACIAAFGTARRVTPEIYPLPLHYALPICAGERPPRASCVLARAGLYCPRSETTLHGPLHALSRFLGLHPMSRSSQRAARRLPGPGDRGPVTLSGKGRQGRQASCIPRDRQRARVAGDRPCSWSQRVVSSLRAAAVAVHRCRPKRTYSSR